MMILFPALSGLLVLQGMEQVQLLFAVEVFLLENHVFRGRIQNSG